MIVNPSVFFFPSLSSCSWCIILPQSFRPLWSPPLNSSLCLMADEAQRQGEAFPPSGEGEKPQIRKLQTEHKDSVLRGRNRSRLFLSVAGCPRPGPCCCWQMMALMTWRERSKQVMHHLDLWTSSSSSFCLNLVGSSEEWVRWGFISKYVSQAVLCVCVWLIWWAWTLDTI